MTHRFDQGRVPTLSSYTVNRKGDGLPITRRQGFKYLNMAPFQNKTAEPFFVTMPYEEAQQNVAIKLSTHAGQELDIILKGTMKVQVGSHIEVLREGDSIYYNSGTPTHDCRGWAGVPVLRHCAEGV